MKVKAAADKMVNGSKLCESAEEVNMSLSDAIEKVGTVMGHTNCALDIRREFIECIERDFFKAFGAAKGFQRVSVYAHGNSNGNSGERGSEAWRLFIYLLQNCSGSARMARSKTRLLSCLIGMW
ncbi:hypothetical protein ERJ75_000528800 [Trypanosoma vivax]|nr:hypothetical protein ERJ75_001626700 [Trypanosoma vivax]KAH8605346.1 hypothetical protein ERJ75_001625900 [Trypanosoma vivax]KAH8615824.1 hypothetical protein ERJ75_000545200 [Trypanosoma vivax]KAH8615947.1 hypothetical protein ERJ75_000528800 [Trypanosoma vivax]